MIDIWVCFVDAASFLVRMGLVFFAIYDSDRSGSERLAFTCTETTVRATMVKMTTMMAMTVDDGDDV